MGVIIVIIILVLLMILLLKMTKKYHITWYWCQNIRDNMVEKRVKKFGQGPPPPLFGQCPKEINFFSGRCSLTLSSCPPTALRAATDWRNASQLHFRLEEFSNSCFALLMALFFFLQDWIAFYQIESDGIDLSIAAILYCIVCLARLIRPHNPGYCLQRHSSG